VSRKRSAKLIYLRAHLQNASLLGEQTARETETLELLALHLPPQLSPALISVTRASDIGDESFEDAIQQGIARATETLHGIRSA
jgi:hypothetical protein